MLQSSPSGVLTLCATRQFVLEAQPQVGMIRLLARAIKPSVVLTLVAALPFDPSAGLAAGTGQSPQFAD